MSSRTFDFLSAAASAMPAPGMDQELWAEQVFGYARALALRAKATEAADLEELGPLAGAVTVYLLLRVDFETTAVLSDERYPTNEDGVHWAEVMRGTGPTRAEARDGLELWLRAHPNVNWSHLVGDDGEPGTWTCLGGK